ncbi:hypothetical protein EAE96_001098 [Botrytis aclada]|nr:hypothetical protein EAE96_001098 [Botrytis aclada]
MKFSTYLVVPALLGLCNAVTLDSLFNTKTAGTGGLGANKAIIQNWLDDTAILVDAALDGINAYQTDENMRNNLLAYFGIRPTRSGKVFVADNGKLTTVANTLQGVQRFLNRQNPRFTVEGDGTGKPWLFYDSTWQEETELIYDPTGKPVPDPKDATKQANFRTFTGSVDASTNSLIKDMQLGTSTNWAKYAYYSSDLRDYVIETKANRYPGSPRSWCRGKSLARKELRFGLTNTNLYRDVVTLCPDAFTTDSEPYETIANAMASTQAKTAGADLDKASPRSLTLFHELIHLTFGNGADDTPDSATKPTECLEQTVNKQSSKSLVNPDSYVFFAWSYYLTKNGNPSYKWHSGFAQA